MTRSLLQLRALVAERFATLPRAELEAWVVQLLTHHQEVQQWLASHRCPSRSPIPSSPSPRTPPRSTP